MIFDHVTFGGSTTWIVKCAVMRLQIFYANFCRNPTRSSTSNKLQHNFTSSNKQSNFYFNRFQEPTIVLDLNQPFFATKSQLLRIFWQHFTNNFDSDNPHSLHLFALVVPAPSLPAHQTSAVISNFFFSFSPLK